MWYILLHHLLICGLAMGVVGCAGQGTGQGTIRAVNAGLYVESLHLPPNLTPATAEMLDRAVTLRAANDLTMSIALQPSVSDTNATQTPTLELPISLTPMGP